MISDTKLELNAIGATLGAQMLKNLPAVLETRV